MSIFGDFIFPIGKYKGKSFCEVYENDLTYHRNNKKYKHRYFNLFQSYINYRNAASECDEKILNLIDIHGYKVHGIFIQFILNFIFPNEISCFILFNLFQDTPFYTLYEKIFFNLISIKPIQCPHTYCDLQFTGKCCQCMDK